MMARERRRETMRTRRAVRLGAGALALWIAAAPIAAQPSRPLSVPPPGKAAAEQIPVLKDVGIDQKPGDQVPLDLEFTNERGDAVRLGTYFGERPVVLALVYYGCPMLCTQVLNGLAGSLQGMSYDVGREYELVVVSFDPGETPSMAADRKREFARRFIRTPDESSIHFLTGRESSIKALTAAVGFRYAWDPAISQWAHPAAVTVLSGEGRISRYLYGVEFAPRDLKLALTEASEGKVGTVVEQMLLFCYHYDPESGRYGLAIMTFVRAAGALTVLVLVGSIVFALRRERRRAIAGAQTATTGTR